MNIIDVMLFALAIGFLFWICATAWEEWRKESLSELTLVAVSVGIFFAWIVGLSIFDAL